MLTKLIDLCLANRPVVLIVTVVLCVFGLASFRELAFDAFPDTTPVQVQVNAVAPALSPIEIERQITFEIEQALTGLPGLVEMRSISKFGFSQVVVVFEEDVDIYTARSMVLERVTTAKLPSHVDSPTLGPVATGLGEVFQYLIQSDTLSAQELRTLHHWVIRPQMLQTQGVAEINTWGGYEKQFHVVVDPKRLIKHEMTLDDVARVLKDGNRNVGGGVYDKAGESQLVQGLGRVDNVEDIRSIVVATVNGAPIHVGDVADVRVDHEIRRGAVTASGKSEAVLGLGFMLMGQNSRDVTERLEASLKQAQRAVPGDVKITPVYRRTDLVDQVLDTVKHNLLVGALLVIAILFMLMGNLRAGLIVATAIPLSMLFAFNAMYQFGIAGTLMSLGAIDFGLVVDSSVIAVENAARRLGSDRSDRTIREVVRDACVEVRRPTLFGELIIAIVYLPILTLEGVEGKLFRPMALTVIFALFGSMIISLTLMPVLASYALKREGEKERNRIVLFFENGYATTLDYALGSPKIVLAIAASFVVSAALFASTLGTEFVPRLREQAVVVNTVRIAGVSLEESVRYGLQIEKLLLDEYPDEIEHIWTRTGTAEVATDPMGLEVSDVFITFTPRDQWKRGRTQDQLVASMRKTLDGMPGMRSIFTQPIEMRVSEMLAGIRTDVGVKIFGDDFGQLTRSADQVREIIEKIDGATDVSVEQLTGQAVLQIDVDREMAGRYGIPVGEVLNVIESFGTRKVGQVFEGQQRFDLVLKIDDTSRETAEEMGKILIRTPEGGRVPLSTVAKIEIVEGPSTIQREWANRRVTIQANVEDRDVGSFVADLRRELETVDLPEGYYWTLGGEFENYDRARERLMVVIPVTLLLVLALLFLTYGRMADALRVFTGVPFAAVGGVLALYLRDLPFSVSAAVGFIALSGVAVLGDIVLVSRIRRLLDDGQSVKSAVREAAITRVRPVLMTAMVAAFGFIPMAVNIGVGAEVQRPLATVVVGGMITSTIATLFVLPVLYASFNRSKD